MRAGAGASMIGSCQTVPVNESAGPRREGTEPSGLISMTVLSSRHVKGCGVLARIAAGSKPAPDGHERGASGSRARQRLHNSSNGRHPINDGLMHVNGAIAAGDALPQAVWQTPDGQEHDHRFSYPRRCRRNTRRNSRRSKFHGRVLAASSHGRRPPNTIENVLEAQKIGGVDISVISNPLHDLRDMDREQQLETIKQHNRFIAAAAGEIRFDLWLCHGHALRRRSFSPRVRARDQGGRPQGRVDHVEPAGPVSRRRRGATVLPARGRARRAGRGASAVGRIRRGADAGLPAGLQHRPSDGRRAWRLRAASCAGCSRNSRR